ncbi:MAG TPA: MASE3 domain-containing protein, partial [Thermoanaerobaculia bacterium]|nr:MASE3 domain-containing protein [Thermoanaerobaculia bacterium]
MSRPYPRRNLRAGPPLAALALLGAGYLLFRLGIPGGPHVHTLQETVSCLLAMGVAAIALVRYYSRKSNRFLLLGAGFLGTAILDGYHALSTSNLFVERFHAPELSVSPWSFLASRIFLATLLILSCRSSSSEPPEQDAPLKESSVYVGT